MTLDTWANTLLQACGCLAEGERILDHCETGFLHMQQGNDADYNVWIARKKMPTAWREHADLRWWTKLRAQLYEAELHALQEEKEQLQPQLSCIIVIEGANIHHKHIRRF
jgi:hypothetical protein